MIVMIRRGHDRLMMSIRPWSMPLEDQTRVEILELSVSLEIESFVSLALTGPGRDISGLD